MELILRGKRVAVIGMARSGIGAAGLAKRLGGSVLVSDMKPAEMLGGAVEELRALQIDVETGGHSRVLKEKFDLVVLSPGVVPMPANVQTWERAGTEIWSELELASRACKSRWIAVTGSNGKTTTVNLVNQMLRHAGLDSHLAGNIGTAWSGLLPAPEVRVFVVEVSSFQLERSYEIHPTVSVFLNLHENHLDRHGDMAEYFSVKTRLAANQTGQDFVVVNTDDKWMSQVKAKARRLAFGTSSAADFRVSARGIETSVTGNSVGVITRDEFPLQGEHNLLNAAAAAAGAHALGVSMESISAGLRTAKPVEHRIEFVRELSGVKYYNDSKSTNLIATMTALRSFGAPVILLFGGRPKPESYRPLGREFAHQLRQVIVFGEAKAKVMNELGDLLTVTEVEDMKSALLMSQRRAQPGDVVLLSPGCASFDQFRDYEERGRVFKGLVREL